MGMAASQARFLGLTARKTNVEYEGQQINQERTALANTSANYYNQMLGMQVPVPPSVSDFTKTVYTFTDGAITNSITSLIAQNNGLYKASYLSNYAQDYSIVSAGRTTIVNAQSLMTRSVNPANTYYVGADKLKGLGDDLYWAYVIRENSQTYRLYENGVNYTYTNANGEEVNLIPTNYDIITGIIGPEPNKADYDMGPLIEDYESTACFSLVNTNTGANRAYHIEHNLCRLIWSDGRASVTSSDGVTLTRTNTNYYSLAHNSGDTTTDQTSKDLQKALATYYPEKYQEIIDLYVENMLYLKKNGNSLLNNAVFTLSTTNFDENRVTIGNLYSRWQNTWETIGDMDYSEIYERDHAEWQAKYDPYVDKYLNAQDYTKVYSLTERQMFYDGDNEYLKSLSSEQLEALYEEEVNYKEMLEEQYGASENGWCVRYVKNTSSGQYEPIFYNKDDLVNGVKVANGDIYSHVATYKIGTKTVNQEIKDVTARLEKDSTGRYTSITLNADDPTKAVTYSLTTNTITDQAAYDSAMNQYEYDKHLYDQAIQETNAKIEIIQTQDKNLELRLKQLDTEQDAIQTEMDAVQKVIEKNTESTFRIFG